MGHYRLFSLLFLAVGRIPSSAGFTATPILSPVHHPAGLPHLDLTSSFLQYGDIQQWIGTVPQDSSIPPLFLDRPATPASTTSTEWSELTADAGDSIANLEVDSPYHGDWMSLPFSRRATVFQLAE